MLLEYWLNRRTYANQKYTNVQELIVLQHEPKLTYVLNVTVQKINLQIQAAYEKRILCKLKAENLGLEYRTQLAIAK